MDKTSPPKVMSLNEFLGLRGLSFPISDFLLDKVRFPHGLTLSQRKRFENEAEKAEREYSAKRKAAIAEYRQLLADGKIQEPSLVEQYLRTAQGHEDNPATQAARRVLAKRGIDWRTEAVKQQTVDELIAGAVERSAARGSRVSDREIEKLWEELTDVPIDEEECLDVDWRDWPKGTHREEIWHWFDENHSKGVAWLMYDYESEPEQNREIGFDD